MRQNVENENLVSIIVPIYNRENFISKCIESLINQKYHNVEILLVDDGSTDNSLNICKKYEKLDNRIVVIHKENGGVQSARNLGIEKSNGKYISFVDADDYVSDLFIENFIKVFNDGDYECVVSGFYKVDASGKIIDDNSLLTSINIGKTEEERWAIYFERFACYVWNHMFLSKNIKDNGIRFDKDIIIFDDTAFTMNYLNSIHSIGFTNSNDYYYVCEHSELTVAKSLKGKRVNDGGCREKVKTCIQKYNYYIKNKYDYNSICLSENLLWLSSVLYHITMISMILYISRVPYDYRYNDLCKNLQFDEFYYYVKNEHLNKWYYNYDKLHTKLHSVSLLYITRFIFNNFHRCIFRLFCDIFGSEFISNIFLKLRFNKNWKK